MKKDQKMVDNVIRGRISVILLFFLVLGIALLIRLFMLQVVYHRDYKRLASRQHLLVREILSERGPIYAQDKDKNLVPLVLNKDQKNLAASPKDIKNPEETADFIVRKFGVARESILKKLTKDEDAYEIILKKIDSSVAEKIVKELPAGLFFEEDKLRVYPHGTLGAQLLGFVSRETDEERGRYGLERFYDEALSGEKGIFEGVKDAAGFWVALGKRIVNPPKNGSSLILTIDYNIQLKAEEVLKTIKEKWSPSSGTVLILEPKTGRILSMAALPTFNPNEYAKENNFSVFLNPLVESMYELGSVLKPITVAGGLEEKLIKPDTTYQDSGEIRAGSFIIKNFDGKSHGVQNMTQVLEKSLNTGAVYVARLLGQKKQISYLKKFGFGESTGVDLPGEVAGNISNLAAGREVDFITASFGQGIAVTPIQMATAIAAIANEGRLLKPYVVDKMIDDSGNEIKTEPVVKRRVISKETAEALNKMLVSAVRNGFENKAGVKGYFVAGKTGTAQIPKSGARGYSDKVVHTFVGYAPAFSPRFLVYLQLNEPRGNRFAANTLTPAFHDLAEYILNYYEVPPDEPH